MNFSNISKKHLAQSRISRFHQDIVMYLSFQVTLKFYFKFLNSSSLKSSRLFAINLSLINFHFNFELMMFFR